MAIPKKEKQNKAKELISKIISEDTFTNIKGDLYLHFERVCLVFGKMNWERSTPGHTLVQVLDFKDKEKICQGFLATPPPKKTTESNNSQRLKATTEQLSKNYSMKENVNQSKDITSGQAIP